MENEKCMRLAIQEGWKAIKEGNPPFASCLLLEDGTYICNHNTTTTNNNILNHSEITLLNEAINEYGSDKLKNAILYTTVFPCIMCYGACCWAEIEKIVYCLDSNDLRCFDIEEKCIDIEQIKVGNNVERSVLFYECFELFRIWNNKRKIIRKLYSRNTGEKEDKVLLKESIERNENY